MRDIILPIFALVHAHVKLSAATSLDNISEQCAESAAHDKSASQLTGKTQPSLMQKTRQTDRKPSELTEIQQTKGESVTDGASESELKVVLQLDLLDDMFVYDHLPKAGGSFVRGILNNTRVIPAANVRIVTESETLTEDDRRRSFTVGSVRNPCNYYVSCWAFGGKVLHITKMPPELYGTSATLNTTDDQLRFRKFLNYTNPSGLTPGLLSSRLLWSYANASVGNASRPEPTSQGWGEQDQRIYYAASRAFDPSSVDCWLKTETVGEDLRRCLILFEERAGGRSIINWAAYNQTLAHQESVHRNQPMDVWSKNSNHQPCEFYFDKASADMILRTESMVFTKFGYPKCCA